MDPPLNHAVSPYDRVALTRTASPQDHIVAPLLAHTASPQDRIVDPLLAHTASPRSAL